MTVLSTEWKITNFIKVLSIVTNPCIADRLYSSTGSEVNVSVDLDDLQQKVYSHVSLDETSRVQLQRLP